MAKRKSIKPIIAALVLFIVWGSLAYLCSDEDDYTSSTDSEVSSLAELQAKRSARYAGIAQNSDLLMPMPRARVNDSAYVISPEAEQRIEAMLADYEVKTSTQIFIVTLAENPGYDANAFTTILGNQWGVGQQGKDNGILIYLRPSAMPPWRDTANVERPYGDYGEGYIALGYGVEQYVTDAQAMRIVRRIMAPYVLAHEYDQAIISAIAALTDLLSPGSSTEMLLAVEDPKEGSEDTDLLLGLFALVAFIICALLFFTIVATPFIILGFFFRSNKSEKFTRFYTRWLRSVLLFVMSIISSAAASHSGSSRHGGGGGFSGGGGGSFGGGGGGGGF